VLAQTPQVFRIDVLKRAFDSAAKDELLRHGRIELGRAARPSHCNRPRLERNIKITRPSDLTLAQAFLEEEEAAR